MRPSVSLSAPFPRWHRYAYEYVPSGNLKISLFLFKSNWEMVESIDEALRVQSCFKIVLFWWWLYIVVWLLTSKAFLGVNSVCCGLLLLFWISLSLCAYFLSSWLKERSLSSKLSIYDFAVVYDLASLLCVILICCSSSGSRSSSSKLLVCDSISLFWVSNFFWSFERSSCSKFVVSGSLSIDF